MRSRTYVKRHVGRVVVHETSKFFHNDSVQQFIAAEIAKKQWIYKIIAGDKEADQVIVNQPEYMILPDADATNDQFIVNWLVIFKDTSLHCIRSLRGYHLQLLLEVKNKVLEVFPEGHKPMLYFHHPPSVWQLHLHVASPCDVLRTTNDMQKVVFLEDVLWNLQHDTDYYLHYTTTYTLPIGHELIKCKETGEKEEQITSSPVVSQVTSPHTDGE